MTPDMTTQQETMRAIVHDRYGPPEVLELKEIAKPEIGADQVLVKVHASSVNPADWHTMKGTPFLVRMTSGLTKPKRTTAGMDVAGTVEAVGKNVERLQPGDEVFGESGGTFAEYAAVPERLLELKPANASFDEAGAVGVAAFTALQGLRDHGKVKAGDSVLINGASGGVGTFAVQIAKALGAEVTAVCSTRNVDQARAIGADHVIDYTNEDFTMTEERFDVILDCVGLRPLSDTNRLLSPDGIYVAVGAPKSMVRIIPRIAKMMLGSRFGSHQTVFFIANANRDDLVVLRDMIESGKVTPVIDRTYPLEETGAAMAYLGEGHAQAKIAITV